MKKTVLALAVVAVATLAAAPSFAQGKCPSGQTFDTGAKKCVDNKRGS